MKPFQILVVLVGLLTPCTVWAYRLQCNKQQTSCQANAKRLVTNDYVGVFDEDGYLVAIGRVGKIDGEVRHIAIQKRYGKILASHDAILIKDHEAKNPDKHFKLMIPVARNNWGVQIETLSMGVGEGFPVYGAEAYYQRGLAHNFFFVGRGGYVRGSGKASVTEDLIASQDIDFASFIFTAGMGFELFPEREIMLRTELSLGGAYVSARAGGSEDKGTIKEIVDGRIYPGMGANLMAVCDVMFHIGQTRPFLGASVYKLQNSLDSGIHLGVYF